MLLPLPSTLASTVAFVVYSDMPQTKKKLVACTQPCRVAAMSVAKHVANEINDVCSISVVLQASYFQTVTLGKQVGYSKPSCPLSSLHQCTMCECAKRTLSSATNTTIEIDPLCPRLYENAPHFRVAFHFNISATVVRLDTDCMLLY